MTQAAILAASGSPGTTTGFKNRIINGGMVISQRNGSTSINPSTTGYPVDRWNCESSLSTVALQQVTDAPAGFTNSIKWTTSTGGTVSAGSYMDVFQRIEGYNVADLAYGTASAQSVAISFWVKSSVTGTFSVNLRLESTGWSYVATYTINSANTWEYKTITIPGSTSVATASTTTGYGLSLTFILGVGATYQTSTLNTWINNGYVGASTGTNALYTTTGATWQLTGVQLEVGTTATNFDFRSYTTELQLCQRYYAQSLPTAAASGLYAAAGCYYNVGWNYSGGSWVGGNAVFPVTMRSTPSVTLYTSNQSASSTPNRVSYYQGAWTNVGAQVTGLTNVSCFSFENSSAGGGTGSNLVQFNWTASAEL